MNAVWLLTSCERERERELSYWNSRIISNEQRLATISFIALAFCHVCLNEISYVLKHDLFRLYVKVKKKGMQF